MDPTVVLILTWVAAGLVVAAYIWFVVWRYRAERRKKAADAAGEAAMEDRIAKAARQATDVPDIAPAVAAAMAAGDPQTSATDAMTSPAVRAASGAPPTEATVAGLLSSIA